MIVTVQDGNARRTGVLLCYDDPEFEEQEQELPLFRWHRYLHGTQEESYVENMILVVISHGGPEVFYGTLVVSNKEIEGGIKTFVRENDENYVLTFADDINNSIERSLQCQGQITNVPIWNGREVVLQRVSGLDQEQEVSGAVFVKEWIGTLCISLYHVTKIFVQCACKNEETIEQGHEDDLRAPKKSPKSSCLMFWLWWPVTKPRSLSVFLREMGKEKTVDLRYFNKNSPITSGIYRVGIRDKMVEGERKWVMKLHSAREASIPIYFDEPDEHEKKSAYHPDFSGEARVIFNRNFALKHGMQPGVNVYGIFGSSAYVTAQLFPYKRDDLCPMFPCLSPWSSLADFKASLSKTAESPQEIGGVLQRARRLCSSLGVVLEELGACDHDYFEK